LTADEILENINTIKDTTQLTAGIVKTPTSPDFAVMMIQIMFTLIIMSIVLYFALNFFKKLNNKVSNQNDTLSFKKHGTIYIQAKQGLSAVSFGEKLYIVGFSQNNVNLIDIIDTPDVIASIKDEKINQNKLSQFIINLFRKGK
jgi:Na+/H+ antiporter NhaC